MSGDPMCRVLIVDDDLVARATWAAQLASVGWPYEAVPGLADADERVAGCDLVLLDLYLRDVGGLDTARHAAAWGRPVVVISGAAGDAEAASVEALPHVMAVLRKGDVTARELLMTLRYARERWQRERSLARLDAVEAELRVLRVVVEDLVGRSSP